jgi:hypothetical protein
MSNLLKGFDDPNIDETVDKRFRHVDGFSYKFTGESSITYRSNTLDPLATVNGGVYRLLHNKPVVFSQDSVALATPRGILDKYVSFRFAFRNLCKDQVVVRYSLPKARTYNPSRVVSRTNEREIILPPANSPGDKPVFFSVSALDRFNQYTLVDQHITFKERTPLSSQHVVIGDVVVMRPNISSESGLPFDPQALVVELAVEVVFHKISLPDDVAVAHSDHPLSVKFSDNPYFRIQNHPSLASAFHVDEDLGNPGVVLPLVPQVGLQQGAYLRKVKWGSTEYNAAILVNCSAAGVPATPYILSVPGTSLYDTINLPQFGFWVPSPNSSMGSGNGVIISQYERLGVSIDGNPAPECWVLMDSLGKSPHSFSVTNSDWDSKVDHQTPFPLMTTLVPKLNPTIRGHVRTYPDCKSILDDVGAIIHGVSFISGLIGKGYDYLTGVIFGDSKSRPRTERARNPKNKKNGGKKKQ